MNIKLRDHHRRSTIAEALEVLLSRHGNKFSPAEKNEVAAAIASLRHLQTIEEASEMPKELQSLLAESRVQKVKGNDLLASLLEQHDVYEKALRLHAQHLASKGK